MAIEKLKIKNFKIFKNETITLKEDINIFVGENDSGKSTILEALSIVTTGKVDGYSLSRVITLDYFNKNARNEYLAKIQKGEKPSPPEIDIEIFFCKDEKYAEMKGQENSENDLNAYGMRTQVIFDEAYEIPYKEMLSNGEVNEIPLEFYKIVIRDFKGAGLSFPLKLYKTIISSRFFVNNRIFLYQLS